MFAESPSTKKPAKSDLVITLKKALLNFKALPLYFYNRYIHKSQPAKSKIVFVISFPRSGTHAIGSLLSNEEVGFRYYGEFFIFNAWQSLIERINHFYPFFSLRYSINLRRQRKSWKYYKFETTSLDAHRTMSAISSLPGIHIIKVFPQHPRGRGLGDFVVVHKHRHLHVASLEEVLHGVHVNHGQPRDYAARVEIPRHPLVLPRLLVHVLLLCRLDVGDQFRPKVKGDGLCAHLLLVPRAAARAPHVPPRKVVGDAHGPEAVAARERDLPGLRHGRDVGLPGDKVEAVLGDRRHGERALLVRPRDVNADAHALSALGVQRGVEGRLGAPASLPFLLGLHARLLFCARKAWHACFLLLVAGGWGSPFKCPGSRYPKGPRK